MDINQIIKEQLTERKDKAIETFLAIDHPHPVFVDLLTALRAIRPQETQQQLLSELQHNCSTYWTNKDRGFNPEQKVRVLLFEYDYYYCVDPEAMAYGIVGEHFKIKTRPYDIGYDYDFVSGMECITGVTLTTLSPLALIGDAKPIEYESVDFYEEPGFTEIIDAYICTTYLILQAAIKEFTQSESFSALPTTAVLHIMIGKHDLGNEQPIYYHCANPKVLLEAIEAQGEPIDDDAPELLLDQKRHLDALIDEENPENITEILQGLHHLVNKDLTSAWAAMKLSTIYKTGFGVEINLDWAIDYMDLAAQKGDSLAKANMAYCYYTGEGRSKDLHKALTLLVEANQHPLLKGKYTPFIEKIQQVILQEGEGTKL